MQQLPETTLAKLPIWENPIALEGEKILFVKRKHWITIFPLITSLVFLSVLAVFALNFGFDFFMKDYILGVMLSLLILAMSFTMFIKIITEWYFAVYVLTNRRLLEISYTPLTSYILNDVLLDQVRCTEIDTSTQGLIYKYLDIGDVIITFDRPTHREAFSMYSIKDFDKISRRLCHWLLPSQQQTQPLMASIQPKQSQQSRIIWYKHPKIPKKFTNFTEILPKPSIFSYPKIQYEN